MTPSSPESPRPTTSRPGSSSVPSAAAAGNEYSAGLWRMAGLGMTMASEAIGGALLGFGLDYLFGTRPALTIIFSVLGVVVGMTGFIRSALGASGAAGRSATRLVEAGRAAPLPDEPEKPDSDDWDDDMPDDAESSR